MNIRLYIMLAIFVSASITFYCPNSLSTEQPTPACQLKTMPQSDTVKLPQQLTR